MFTQIRPKIKSLAKKLSNLSRKIDIHALIYDLRERRKKRLKDKIARQQAERHRKLKLQVDEIMLKLDKL